MLRRQVEERPRVVAFVVGALWVLIVTVAIVGGLVGAALAGGGEPTVAELRAVKADNTRLERRARALRADAAAAQRRAKTWRRRYGSERRRSRALERRRDRDRRRR